MSNINHVFSVVGVMSGTSLDGLDLAHILFKKSDDIWSFDLKKIETVPYSGKHLSFLKKTYEGKIDIKTSDIYFGEIISKYIERFALKNQIKYDLISSHGHTIFHNPDEGFSIQIGSGEVISRKLSKTVVCNFRQQDINLGGQGAPLVPVGDEYLFNKFSSCLNLGGISNISYKIKSKRIAYDISPCNIILNFISNKIGKKYDRDGKNAASGNVNSELLKKLNSIDYCFQSFPKSLSLEYIEKKYFPIINDFDISKRDLLATSSEHIAQQISIVFNKEKIKNSLLSGGGVFNSNLLKRIRNYTETELIIPDKELIEYKEAIVFGFLGVLKYLNLNNCFSSVTGSSKDHSSGDIYKV
tara:strand:+ start:534 stop:1601 length:1068 start_codon:yes stop_codon:yes gene_type:complete